jgi:hypothetical protein
LEKIGKFAGGNFGHSWKIGNFAAGNLNRRFYFEKK